MKTIAFALIALAVMTLVVALTGCAEYPIAIAVSGDGIAAGYSSKGGLAVSIQK